MDRLSEKKKRITEQVVPYVKKLHEDPKNHWEFIEYDTQRFCRRTWMLSAPVARDYAAIAVGLVRQ